MRLLGNIIILNCFYDLYLIHFVQLNNYILFFNIVQ